MAVQPLKQNDNFFDPVLNAVLSADGTVNIHDCHEFTMVWPSYTALDLPDGSIQRLIPCKFDVWTSELEYVDPTTNMTTKINLATGTKSTMTAAAPTPPPSWGAPKSNSQKDMGWAYPDTPKEQSKNTEPFKKGAVLFHKPSRSKWVYDKVESSGYILRSFHDKSQTMNIFDRELGEFEEVFF